MLHSDGLPSCGTFPLNARITLGGTELLGADIPSAEPMRSAYLSLAVDSDTEAERIFSTVGRRRTGLHAHAGDVLRQPIRPAAGSVRHQLDDPARKAKLLTGVAATPQGWADFIFVISTLRVWLRRGRDFTAADRMSAPPVAIVSASLTGQVWPGEDPLSRLDCRIRDGGSVPA